MKKQEIALEKSAELWNAFLDITSTEMHSDDTNDFRHHLHALQNILYTQLYKNKDVGVKATFNKADLDSNSLSYWRGRVGAATVSTNPCNNTVTVTKKQIDDILLNTIDRNGRLE